MAELKEVDFTNNLKETIKRDSSPSKPVVLSKKNIFEEFFNSANAYLLIVNSKTGAVLAANNRLLNILGFDINNIEDKTLNDVFKTGALIKDGISTNTLLSSKGELSVQLRVSSAELNNEHVLFIIAFDKSVEPASKSLMGLKASNLALLKAIERLKEYEKKLIKNRLKNKH